MPVLTLLIIRCVYNSPFDIVTLGQRQKLRSSRGNRTLASRIQCGCAPDHRGGRKARMVYKKKIQNVTLNLRNLKTYILQKILIKANKRFSIIFYRIINLYYNGR